jgi:Ogr/Delta-like zinc finger
MRLRCPHCGEFGTIRSSEQMTECVSNQYVQCGNLECGHTWRATTTAEVTLSPSAIPNSRVNLPLSTHVKSALLTEQLGRPKFDYQPTGALQGDIFEGGMTL